MRKKDLFRLREPRSTLRSKLGFLVRGGGGGGDGVGVPSFPFMSWIFQPRPLQPSSSFPPACLPACLPASWFAARQPISLLPSSCRSPSRLAWPQLISVPSIFRERNRLSASLCQRRDGGKPVRGERVMLSKSRFKEQWEIPINIKLSIEFCHSIMP